VTAVTDAYGQFPPQLLQRWCLPLLQVLSRRAFLLLQCPHLPYVGEKHDSSCDLHLVQIWLPQ
jgi:hypothetical protein